MIPMPQRIKDVVLQHRGVCLATTDTGFYVVGTDYTLGSTLTRWEPTTDFFASRDAGEARQKYLEYAGIKPRTGSVPPETAV